MGSTLEIWRFIARQMDDSIPVMLLYVVESVGSSPGRQGFSMAVNAGGETTGSIGGGIMEHKFAGMAKEIAGNKSEYLQLQQQIHNKEAPKNQSGMICSGEQTILLYLLQPGDALTIKKIINCLETHGIGCLTFSPAGMAFTINPPAKQFTFTKANTDDWRYEELVGYKDHLYIIGAGHCGQALARLMPGLDFYTHVYDEREQQHSLQLTDVVHEFTVLNTYQEAVQYIKEGVNSYVVVMTSGYRTDDLVIRSLLHKQFRYLGLLGSAKKIEKLFAGYLAEGIEPGLLRNIHAPVGLPVKSRTPHEIAISIAAQIIAVKNE